MAATVRKQKSSPEVQRNYPGGQTMWKAGVPAFGWYKMADSWWEDLARLQRGLYQRMLIEFAWAATVPREEGVPLPEWSPWLSWSDMAARFRCSPEQLRDDARDAAKRSMIAVEEAATGQTDEAGKSLRGMVRVRILWAKWPNLKDYVAPKPQLVEKKQPKISAHWFGKDRDIEPGESWKYSVTDLPANFQLQGFVFKNTGESGRVTIAGGGPAEDGLIVLETKARLSDPAESKTSATKAPQKRDSTPQSPPQNRDSTPQSDRFALSSPLIESCAKFRLTSDDAIKEMVLNCRKAAPECSDSEITDQVLLIGGNGSRSKSVHNLPGLVKTQVPKYFASEAYRHAVKKKPVEKVVQKADCHRCQDTGLVGYGAVDVSFGDVRRELSEGRELCGCHGADIWREMMKDVG